MLYVTKTMRFNAAHRLYNPEFSENKNDEIFDKCNNYYGHGHNYRIDITVKGLPNPDTGYVIDLKVLKRIIKEEIIDKVDHKHLNFDVDFLQGIIPTVENLAVVFWALLKNKLPSGEMYKIALYETEDSFVEYYGEEVLLKRFENK